MICIIGPTASGKTRLAAQLAYMLGSEVISADSRQVYRGMDIGTGKDIKDYKVEGTDVPYHLIDILPAGEQYNLYAYQHDFHRAYQDIKSRGVRYPILCGGTGMYVEAVLKGYHLPNVPANVELRQRLQGQSLEALRQHLATYGPLHNTTDVDSAQRAIRAIEIAEYIRTHSYEATEFSSIDSLIVCLDLPREERRRRITERLRVRVEEGLIQEAEHLLASGVSAEALISYGLEYKYLTYYLMGQISREAMLEQLEVAIHQFAKRQMTWFRGMERRGLQLHYLDALLPLDAQLAQIFTLMQGRGWPQG